MNANAGRRHLALSVLGRALRPRWRAAAAVAGWSAVSALPALVLGRAMAGATDAFLARRVEIGFGWLALLVLAAAVGALGGRQVYRALGGIVEPLRDELLELVVVGALRRSGRPGAAPETAAVARITQHVESVRDTFAGVASILSSFVFTAAAALIGLVTLAPVAAVFVVPPLLVALALFAAMLRPLARRLRDSIVADEAVAQAAGAAVGGLRDVVACGGADSVQLEVGIRIRAQAAAARAVAALGGARAVILAIGGWVPLASLLLASPWLVRGGMTVGTVLGMLAYVRGALQPALRTLVQGMGGSGTRLRVMVERIVETSSLDGVEPEPAAAAVAGRPLPAGGAVELRGVTFAYGRAAAPVIDRLDLVIPEGDHLVVVGPSGIGKSTLAALLAGVLSPLEGEVRLGGVALPALEPAGWLAHRALIPQEAYVFAGTLRENLVYLAGEPGRAQADERVDDAVEAVGLGPLVARLGGCDAQVEAAALSAGERQLVALARAYLSPARLVVLDEATCHLDPAAEARAELAFARRPGTLVIVAHRVSSALRARRVLALDGTLAIAGTPDAVLERSAMYRDLVGHWRWAEPSVPAPASVGN
jgi:ATP-binding cassette subfamily C protein